MIDIPEVEKYKVEEIVIDEKNPNEMKPETFVKLKNNIKKYGFLVPIIINKDNVIADGEHRLKAAKELGLNEIPCVKVNVEEVDRKIIRQVMNKLSGKHKLKDDEFNLNEITKEIEDDELSELLPTEDLELINEFKDMEEETEEPEVEITPEYLEEYNYVVVFFDNELDWNVFTEKIPLKTVKSVEPEDKFKKIRKGTGRVIKAKRILEKLK